jgi:SAM-dependent methyltransferase
MVNQVCQGGWVLDLGCNSLAATRLLGDEFQIMGIDINNTALQSGKQRLPDAFLILADLRALPLAQTDKIDTALALDVIEHLERGEAIELLTELKKKLGFEFHLIVSMPIISPISVPCLVEGLGVARNFGRRPASGLFDRTHRIFADRSGHRKLFDEAGYGVLEEGLVGKDRGIICGSWETIVEPKITRRRRRLYRAMVAEILPRVLGERITEELAGYQALYLLRPKKR